MGDAAEIAAFLSMWLVVGLLVPAWEVILPTVGLLWCLGWLA